MDGKSGAAADEKSGAAAEEKSSQQNFYQGPFAKISYVLMTSTTRIY